MSSYAIKGRLIDVIEKKAIEQGLVVTENERIVYAGEADGYEIPSDAVLLEADTILPGFIDCHIHMTGEEDAGNFADGRMFGDQLMGAVYQSGLLVDAGFTGIRDMSEAGLYLSRAQARGILRAPKIIPGGKLLGITSGHVDDNPELTKEEINKRDHCGRLCDGVDDCIRAVREQFRAGAKFIKICATGGVSSPTDRVDDVQFSKEELEAIVQETKRHHSYVAAHCTGNEGAYQGMLAGVECIEHGVMLTQREIDLMAEKNIPLVSTLAVSLGVAKMPGLPQWLKDKAVKCAEYNKRTIDMARKAGITIAFGTDYSNSKNTPFRHIGKEFEAMTEAGMTNMEAICAGTINAAKVCRTEKETGSLEAGKYADITLVNGNPLEDIRVLGDAKNITGVLINGKKEK